MIKAFGIRDLSIFSRKDPRQKSDPHMQED
jgi:hypothetical protein